MFEKLDLALSKVLEFIMVVGLVITVIMTFVQVVLRYVFSTSLPWSQEFLMLTFVYSVFAGAAYLAYKNEHLVVDLFDNLSDRTNKIFSLLEIIVTLTVLFVFAYFGWILVQQNLQSGQTLTLLPYKRAYLYMAIPVSAIFMIYFYLRRFFKVCFGSS
ncbi:MAG TPA: TRAP transporter small permease [Aliicoccus persicus]|uniref:TRAP transporter small permease n=1 Tax=Aliicoccus persicus TaxID=930138 RepID=A0A921DX57_9STAP|nr:TRAP transporter small permease [Aliicoccus persicus]